MECVTCSYVSRLQKYAILYYRSKDTKTARDTTLYRYYRNNIVCTFRRTNTRSTRLRVYYYCLLVVLGQSSNCTENRPANNASNVRINRYAEKLNFSFFFFF